MFFSGKYDRTTAIAAPQPSALTLLLWRQVGEQGAGEHGGNSLFVNVKPMHNLFYINSNNNVVFVFKKGTPNNGY